MNRIPSILLCCALALAAVSSPALADGGPRVVNVLSFEVEDMEKFIALTKRAAEIQAKLGTGGTQRVLVSLYSGSGTGTPFVVLDYPDMETLVAADRKTDNSEEWAAFLVDVQAAGVRIVSNSVSVDVTP